MCLFLCVRLFWHYRLQDEQYYVAVSLELQEIIKKSVVSETAKLAWPENVVKMLISNGLSCVACPRHRPLKILGEL